VTAAHASRPARRRFVLALGAILCLAALLRGIFPSADPPWHSTVGVVWHDEGAWVHNARNKALFGAWRTDEWNPVYVAPVFTGLEYLSFATFGVGLWQARLVSAAAGFCSVLLLALGVRRIAGSLAGLLAGALLATNYVYVMYNRAAIMEALMASFIVASWYCSTRAARAPVWGAAAGLMATLAFFTKAAAVFYLGALGLVAIMRWVAHERWAAHDPWAAHEPPLAESFAERRTALWTLAGLAGSFALIAVFFVLPSWTEYRFYNWQMSVTRKPSYDPSALLLRLSWFPILHDTFSRMWPALCAGLLGAWGIVTEWRRASDGERLLVLWVAVGSLELLIHDVGNERRFVFLIPALVALTGIVLARGSLLPAAARSISRRQFLLALPLILYSAYVLLGPLTRVAYLEQVYAHALRMPVRLAAGGAVILTAVLIASWPTVAKGMSTGAWGARVAIAAVTVGVAWNLAQFGDWAARRTYENFEASVALGRVLPAGTLVQGKLANGLALENRIRPIFIGHQFGNYADRKERWDVRYILTYTDPEIGYEGDQILDVLAAYPGWRIIMTFDVAETRSGHDTAALIEKRARD
jgi:4-amino-4-deoxy-L-arabinose transferase-like glycosyltransferase